MSGDKPAVNFDEIKAQVIVEHNKVRKDPKSYIPILEEQIKYFKENVLARPGEVPVQTNEGKDAFTEAIEFLKNQAPVSELTEDANLSKACNDHCSDIGPKGIVSHDSSDGKNVSDRIEVYTEWDAACGENLDFGSKNAVDIMVNLIVDDGVEKRSHRRHIFNDKFCFVGVAIGDHKEYEVVCVIDYVGGVRELGTPHFDFNNFKYQYPEGVDDPNRPAEKKKPKTQFQIDDPDAPDETVSVKIQKSTKFHQKRVHKITKKCYQLKDGTTHIVEVEDV